MISPSRIVFYDGVCGFCQGTVQFILARDREGLFHFCALQSSRAEALLKNYPGATRDLDSVVLLEGDRAFFRTDAVLRIASRFPGAWKLTRFLLAVPRPIRDGLYRAFAKRRYRWFGRLDVCPLPSPETRARFLE